MSAFRDNTPPVSRPTVTQPTASQPTTTDSPPTQRLTETPLNDSTTAYLDAQNELRVFSAIRHDIVAEVDHLLRETEPPTAIRSPSYYIRDGPLAGGLFSRTHDIGGVWTPMSPPTNMMLLLPSHVLEAMGDRKSRRGAFSDQGGVMPTSLRIRSWRRRRGSDACDSPLRMRLGVKILQAATEQEDGPPHDYRDRRVNTPYIRRLVEQGLEDEEMQDTQMKDITPAVQGNKSVNDATDLLRNLWISLPAHKMKRKRMNWEVV